jgi:azurin
LALTSQAWSQNCSFTIEANDQMQFNMKEIRVSKSCKEVTVNLKHVGMLAANLMGHNWVLSPTPEFQAVAQAGQAAGAPNYTPAGDKRVIAAYDGDRRGQQTSVKFDIPD